MPADPLASTRHEQELLTCVHCGFCLNSCPTYLETGSEADSPRGRIVMMRALHEGDLVPGEPSLRRHLDACLGCRACEPACPSGVPYGNLIEYARAEINAARPPVQRFARQALLNTLSKPKRASAAAAFSRFAGERASRIALRLLQSDTSSGDEASIPALNTHSSGRSTELPAFIPAVGQRRARVGMLTGCVMRAMYGDVNSDTALILAANGCDVIVNQAQGCCGALHLHHGEPERGKRLAWQLIEAFGDIEDLDAIVINSAGCGSTMKEYGRLFAGDKVHGRSAELFAAKCKDVSEFIDELGWVAPLLSIDAVAAYHDACHLAQAQGITAAPRRLLSLIPGLTLVPLLESEVCCGSAGIYNLTQPAMAKRLQSRKLDCVEQTGATILVTGNPGCMAWIQAGMVDRGGHAVEVVHPATLLRRALLDEPV